jgi:hypothetical protein
MQRYLPAPSGNPLQNQYYLQSSPGTNHFLSRRFAALIRATARSASAPSPPAPRLTMASP